MKRINDKLIQAFGKFDLLFDGEIISREKIIEILFRYLSENAEINDHNKGLVLHNGSDIFDAVMVAYAALSDILYNETDYTDVVLSLKEGDKVIYNVSSKPETVVKNQVFIFKGFSVREDNTEVIILSQGKNGTISVSEKRWRLIQPYSGGGGISLDGRGLRSGKNVRHEFFTEVLGYDANNVPSVISVSSVIVIARDKADRLVSGLSFRFSDKSLSLKELVTASYFTETTEYCYSGNQAKSEAVLKFTSKLSVGRRLILEKGGNKNIGLLILGEDILRRSETELQEMLNKKSIQYVFTGTGIDTEFGERLLTDNEDLSLFPCTKDFLRSLPAGHTPNPGNLVRSFCSRNDTIIACRAVSENSEGIISKSRYIEFRNSLFFIKASEYESDVKDDFIIQAYSLMALFNSAPFTMKDLEETINNKEISDIKLPSDKLGELSKLAEILPDYLKEKAYSVCAVLGEAYKAVYEFSWKKDKLLDYIHRNPTLQIAVIVPKSYYIPVLHHIGLIVNNVFSNITVSTSARFDTARLYDMLLLTGDLNTRHFSSFRYRGAENIVSLLYECELPMHKRREYFAQQTELLYNKRSSLKYEFDMQEPDPVTVPSTAEEFAMDSQIDDYIEKIKTKISIREFGGKSSASVGMSEVTAAAAFESGERAFFTKFYKPYVFNEATGTVEECEITDLSEGDSIIFTKNNDETKDIVDSILNKLVDEASGNENTFDFALDYKLSKLWKKALWLYMKQNSLTVKNVAAKMKQLGCDMSDVTIRNWIDRDSHVVGPRDEASMKCIAEMLGKDLMPGSYQLYFKACSSIRSVRMDILKQIGNVIIDKMRGIQPQKGIFTDYIYDRIDTLCDILKVDTISVFEEAKKVPANYTNRPISE